MKHLIKPWLLIFIFSALSCDSYLSEPPDNRQELNSPEDLSALLVKAYPAFSPLSFTVRASDNVTFISSRRVHIFFYAFVYRYQLPVGEAGNRNKLNDFWVASYDAIAQANLVLEMIDQFTQYPHPLAKKAIRGEALLCRAYNHFMLANVFCQAYSEQADQHLGIPYITTIEKELVTHYERETLKETYEKIEADLLTGLPLIAYHQYKGVIAKYHFSKESALALASRFFLFKGDYEKCIKYSNDLLGAGVVTAASGFIRDAEEVFQRGTKQERARKFQSPSGTYNLLLMEEEGGCGVCARLIQSRYEADIDVFSEVFSNNIQESEDHRNVADVSALEPFGPHTTLKYPGTFYRGRNVFALFRSEEVIFNRMESQVKLGELDQALADYNAMAPLRYESSRWLTQAQITAFFRGSTPQEAMLKFILREKRKEFFHEGLRWFDIKRHGLSITHKDGNANFILRRKDPKKAFQIPRFAIAEGIKENPGWGE